MLFMCTLPVLTILIGALGASARAQTGCEAAIAQFRRVIDADVATGHVHKSVYNRIVPELTGITASCRAGRDPQAMSALTALKRRHGYH